MRRREEEEKEWERGITNEERTKDECILLFFFFFYKAGTYKTMERRGTRREKGKKKYVNFGGGFVRGKKKRQLV